MNITNINEQLNEINILLDKLLKINIEQHDKKHQTEKTLFIQGTPLNFQITPRQKYTKHENAKINNIEPEPNVMDLNDEYSALLKQVMYA